MREKPEKLTYGEPVRFDVDASSLEGHRRGEDYNFRMTCSCGQTFLVPLDVSGNAALCPKCSRQVKIPEAELMPITCPCGKSLRIPRVMTGHGKKCPQCKQPVKFLAVPAEQDLPVKLAEKPKAFHICVNCPCGEKLAVPLTDVHRQIKCPSCKNLLKVPENNFIRMTCSCGTEFNVLRMLEGRYGRCPKCGNRLKISEIKA